MPLVHAVVRVWTVLIPFGFSFTAPGHAERYIPSAEVPAERESVAVSS